MGMNPAYKDPRPSVDRILVNPETSPVAYLKQLSILVNREYGADLPWDLKLDEYE
jgi:hypothetical protein